MKRIKGKRWYLTAIVLISLLSTTILIGTSSYAVGPDEGPCLTCGPAGQVSPDETRTQCIIPGPDGRLYNAAFNGGYSAAGTGMRNRGWGTILINDIPAGSRVKAAYLFWSIIGPPGMATPPSNYAVGRINGSSVTGKLLGSVANPCWPGGLIFGYVAAFSPFSSACPKGNGVYRLDGFTSGDVWGDDPWIAPVVPPEVEGASLVIIYSNYSLPLTRVQIIDGAIALNGLTTADITFTGFTATSSPAAKTTFIVADGQDASESVQFNGNEMPGNFCDGIDRQDGPDFSLGNLQDTNTADVSAYVSPGATSATATIAAGTDCLTWLAQVFSVTVEKSLFPWWP
jgi:hypothetical protein